MPRLECGKLIVFEGADETGKSSLSKAVAEFLTQSGEDVLSLAFPGNTPGTLGALIYSLHHRPTDYVDAGFSIESLQILHLAAHFDSIDRLIKPALESGKTVVLDRFWWSLHTYGMAGNGDPEIIKKLVELEKARWGGVIPDVLFLLKRESPLAEVTHLPQWQSVCNEYDRLAKHEKKLYRVVEVKNETSFDETLSAILDTVGRHGRQKVKNTNLLKQEAGRFNIHVSISPAKPTEVYDTYWKFAAIRQEAFFRKINCPSGPWTSDPVLAEYKFTNAYRASDRVSQFLIQQVQYDQYHEPEDLLFRTLLFKTFNRIDTWKYLMNTFGEIRFSSYQFSDYDRVLTSMMAEGPIYSAAYIMTSGRSAFGSDKKHRNHLKLIESMMRDELPLRIQNTRSMAELFDLLLSYPTLGNFLAYQYSIDINYSELTNYSEMQFVVPGPGARDGLRKCFEDFGGLNEADMIRLVTERQELEFDRLGIDFMSLWGRPLQLIDCQNLFCEVDKYARVVHPTAKGISGRTRIKQKYRSTADPIRYWYPPKWGINDLIYKGGKHVPGF